MLALLAPAKTIDASPSPIPPTAPVFLDDARALTVALRGLDPRRRARLWGLKGAKLREADAALARFTGALERSIPAAHAFAGEVFRAFGGRALSSEALAWAQDRVGVLSGLYGLLRPLDGIEPHRLEMSARLPTPRGHNLYAHWGERITLQVNALTRGHADRACVDLSSQEYAKVLWPRSLEGPLVECVFESLEGGAPRVIPTHARRARGLMARFVVETRAETVDALRAFDSEGYAFAPARSSEARLVFTRA